jgi:hypothetical protein
MWCKRIFCAVVCVLAVGCGGSGDDDDSGSVGTGGATALGTGGSTGGAATGTGGSTTTAAGTGTGGMGVPMCPAEPGPSMCGSEACTAPSGAQAMACFKTCCTADGKCGTHNALLDASGSMCIPAYTNDTMCPNETIFGQTAQGCCVMNSNDCGIYDTLTGMGCLSRTSPILSRLAMLAPAHCDGTPVMMTGTGGMGAAGQGGGTGGMGAAGQGGGTGGMSAGSGGMSGAGTGGMSGAGTGGMTGGGTGGMN